MRSSLRGRGGIFICYRREDTSGQAGRLYDHLSNRFGKDRVFMDVDTIASGVDFTEKVIGNLSECNALLALIGRHWSAITDSNGRRIDSPDDPVRVEIEVALQRNITVVPVLVDGAELPQVNDLPPSLQPLIRRQARELRHASFQSDVTRLIADIDEVIGRKQPPQLTVTRIRAPAVNVPALAEALRGWYESNGLESTVVTSPTALMVQCRTLNPLQRASGMSDLLTVILRADGEDLVVECQAAKFLGKAKTAKVAAAGVGVAAAVVFVPYVPVMVGAAAVGMGAWRLRQQRLSNQTISFLRETAPIHVRSA